ncbi:MAG: transcriptional repressor [Chloroflexi bacterium]|nr:transcriptional repressor [Chloroflexota bacterium]
MGCESKLAEQLRGAGLRLTPQRLMVLSTLRHNPGHLSAEEVFRLVKADYPYLDISTVYRTLDILKEHHLITETDLGQARSQYEWTGEEPHHHLICRRCGQVMPLEHRFMEDLQRGLEGKYRFQADIDHLAIFGLCSSCR